MLDSLREYIYRKESLLCVDCGEGLTVQEINDKRIRCALCAEAHEYRKKMTRNIAKGSAAAETFRAQEARRRANAIRPAQARCRRCCWGNITTQPDDRGGVLIYCGSPGDGCMKDTYGR